MKNYTTKTLALAEFLNVKIDTINAPIDDEEESFLHDDREYFVLTEGESDTLFSRRAQEELDSRIAEYYDWIKNAPFEVAFYIDYSEMKDDLESAIEESAKKDLIGTSKQEDIVIYNGEEFYIYS